MEREKLIGRVVWFDPKKLKYGFISREGEKDIFVHYSDIAMEGYKTLKKDQKVSFLIGTNNAGSPKAIEVTVIDEEE